MLGKQTQYVSAVPGMMTCRRPGMLKAPACNRTASRKGWQLPTGTWSSLERCLVALRLDREEWQGALQPLERLISSSSEPELLWPILSTHWCDMGHSVEIHASVRFSACEYREQILQEPVADNWRGYQACIHQAKVTLRKCVTCWYLSGCRLVHIIYSDVSCCAK